MPLIVLRIFAAFVSVWDLFVLYILRTVHAVSQLQMFFAAAAVLFLSKILQIAYNW